MAELRETIEMLKTQNTDAQTAIQVALNGPDHLHKGNEETSRGCWATLKSCSEEALNTLQFHNYWMHFQPDWPQGELNP